MEGAPAIWDAIEQGFAARSVDELDAIMLRAAREHGVSVCSAIAMRDGEGNISVGRQFGHDHGPWSAHYRAHGYFRYDPIVRSALASPSPIRWTTVQGCAQLQPEERRLFNEAREFGLRDGFITPVHQCDGAISVVALSANEVLELSPEDQNALRLLSLYYHTFGMALSRTAAPTMLTERQRECLKWVGAGKTSWEISTILRISEHTVTFHIREACRRLGVSTRAQAVVQAIVLGLIMP
ncbi:MAG: autoinducer binding domain-containing protein [Alphaproteobacteria bacterium]